MCVTRRRACLKVATVSARIVVFLAFAFAEVLFFLTCRIPVSLFFRPLSNPSEKIDIEWTLSRKEVQYHPKKRIAFVKYFPAACVPFSTVLLLFVF
jgi:hypothetical protein